MSTLLDEVQSYLKNRETDTSRAMTEYLTNVIKGLITQPEESALFNQPNGYVVHAYDLLAGSLAKASGIKREDLAILRFDLSLSALWDYLSEEGHLPDSVYESRLQALAAGVMKAQDYFKIPKAKLLFEELGAALDYLLLSIDPQAGLEQSIRHRAAETE